MRNPIITLLEDDGTKERRQGNPLRFHSLEEEKTGNLPLFRLWLFLLLFTDQSGFSHNGLLLGRKLIFGQGTKVLENRERKAKKAKNVKVGDNGWGVVRFSAKIKCWRLNSLSVSPVKGEKEVYTFYSKSKIIIIKSFEFDNRRCTPHW